MEAGMNEAIRSALPPSSIDAERSVLGAMMQDSGAASLAFENLAPEDFYSAEHKEIFQAMRDLHIAGNPIDLMTTGNELTRRGTFDSIGGAAYLSRGLGDVYKRQTCCRWCALCPPRPIPAPTFKSCWKNPPCAG